MRNFKPAFTMVELIFVIVILGILATIAVPKFAGIKEQSDISNARADIASIRSSIISERQNRLIRGESNYISAANLDTTAGLFGGVLMYPIANTNATGHWYTATTGNGSYEYKTAEVDVTFTYNATTGIFSCDTTTGDAEADMCKRLIN